MSLSGGLFAIELNGKEVVSENIEPTSSRRIGLFHDAATTDLRVRNVVLSGENWPKELIKNLSVLATVSVRLKRSRSQQGNWLRSCRASWTNSLGAWCGC